MQCGNAVAWLQGTCCQQDKLSSAVVYSKGAATMHGRQCYALLLPSPCLNHPLPHTHPSPLFRHPPAVLPRWRAPTRAPGTRQPA